MILRQVTRFLEPICWDQICCIDNAGLRYKKLGHVCLAMLHARMPQQHLKRSHCLLAMISNLQIFSRYIDWSIYDDKTLFQDKSSESPHVHEFSRSSAGQRARADIKVINWDIVAKWLFQHSILNRLLSSADVNI